MGELVVRTRRTFAAPASTVWPLLCESRMDGTTSSLFRLGVPLPVECRLPEGHGGVGSERECVSDQGVVHQRILAWEPEHRLAFRMESTDLPFRRYVENLVDTFELVSTDRGVEVTRTTRAWVQGRLPVLRKVVLFVSLKHVHRYVFRNWLRLSKEATSSAGPQPHRTPVHPAP
jgi:hypothetical protein